VSAPLGKAASPDPYAWGMRKALLSASAAVVVLVGCGGSSATDRPPPQAANHKLYVICSGKPRYCAVADTTGPHPEWVSADELGPAQARRFRRFVGAGSLPLPP
jgi:hypothetical protein